MLGGLRDAGDAVAGAEGRPSSDPLLEVRPAGSDPAVVTLTVRRDAEGVVLEAAFDAVYWNAECCVLTDCDSAPAHRCCLDSGGPCPHGRED